MTESREPDTPKNPIILCLAHHLVCLPLESTQLLSDQPITRMPSLPLCASHLAIQMLRGRTVDPRETYYVLDPRGDLPSTHKTFGKWFSEVDGWQGIVGQPPSKDQFSSALENSHTFMYVCVCGLFAFLVAR